MVIEWKICEKEFIRIVSRDEKRVESIISRALERLNIFEQIKVNEKSVSFVVENYYEVIKELLVAYLLRDGLKSNNHQCLISYFYKKNPEYEKQVLLMSQMSFFRNRLNYYGESIPKGFYDNNKEEFKKIIKLILKILKRGKNG